MKEVVLRKLMPSDSAEELTALLHRAYKALAHTGFRFLATHQDAATTRKRAESGECYVGLLDGAVVATLTFYNAACTGGCEWYDGADVASFGQFAVEPALQGSGIGSRLLAIAEERANETGAAELALDTAEDAEHLVAWYGRKGYRLVGRADWDETNYESVIMSKRLVS